VSGFGDPEVREILRPLAPAVVVRPWTDGAPDAAPTLLEEWGSAGRTANVRAGDTVDALPRVTVQVLAPPGADGPPGPVRTGSIALADGAPSAPRDDAPSVPVVDAWAAALRTVADPGGVGVAERLIRVLVGRPSAAGLLHVADRGEESLVLLVTVGNRKVLLPGDAGIASWAPVLDRARGRDGVPKDPRLARQLTDVDVYKVGRGTPGRLRRLWERRVGSARPLVSVLSALPAGGPGVGPPDDPLVADLGRIGTVHSTGELPPTVWWFDVEAPTSGRAAVTYTPGPVR
jgi:hypothetical protein